MRVALLAPDVNLSAKTGDAWHVKDVSLALARAGTTVDLVVAEPAGWPGGEGIHIHQLAPGNALCGAIRLQRQFGLDRPDVLYERRESAKLSASLAQLSGRPYFVEINGMTGEEKAMQGRPDSDPRWIQKWKAAVRGRLLRGARGIVTVTEGLRREVMAEYRVPSDRFVVIPNGVDLGLFRPWDKDEARRQLGLQGPGPYLVYVGNLVAWQGIPTLLGALNRIRQKWPQIEALIVGDGIERLSLEAKARDLGVASHVRFVGWQPRERVPLWISAADIAVMPATLRRNQRIGSSALKLREYLACGRPVLATNFEGGGPFLERHGVGRGTRGDEPEDFATVTLSLLADPAAMETMGTRARILAERELSWDLVAQRLLAFFAIGMDRGT